MCLAVPARVEELNGKEARCAVEGITLRVRMDLVEEVQVGDFVLVHAGFAIYKLEEPDALETLALLREAGRFD